MWQRPERGPLEGLAAGLRALPSEIDAVYVTSCDVPLLAPAFVKQMLAAIGDHDIALPRDGEYRHPLAAVYRPAVLGAVERLLAADCLRLQSLLHESRTREVPVSQLRRVDPQLGTLWNLNEPQDYEAALRAAGLTA